jgi:hypothetical protein
MRETSGCEPLLERDVGQEAQRPSTSRTTEVARALVQDALELLGLLLVEDGSGVFGTALLFSQAVEAPVVEGVDGVSHGAGSTAQPRSDLGGVLGFGTG